MSDEFEYRVVSDSNEPHFKRMVEKHLNDKTGWQLAGGVSITTLPTAFGNGLISYAQALVRKKLN